MRRLTLLSSLVVILGLFRPIAWAGNIDLYDIALSVNGGVSGDWQDVAANDPTALPGVATTMACCGDASGGTTPGLGAYQYTFDPSVAGSYTVSMYFDYDASTPYFNEYGTINDGAGAQAGITYEIFNASSATSNIQLFGVSGIPLGEVYGLANGANNVPGTTDNFLDTCTAASCNADVGVALTYSFTLGANQQAILTALSSTTDPGGFSLETTHPVDANNTTATNVFLTGSYSIESVVTGTPEPSTWILFGSALVLFGVGRGLRKAGR
jgi:hypothetical protein